MSGATEYDLVREDTSTLELGAGATVGFAVVLFGFGLAGLFELVAVTESVAGVQLPRLLGGLLTLASAALAWFGVASHRGLVPTDPRPSAGVVAATGAAGVWFVVGGLVGSQTLGFGTVGWLALALLAGAVGFAATALPREDLGTTLPVAALTGLGGLALLTDVIGPDWAWSPVGLRATFAAPIAIPIIVLFCSLLVGWAGAKAYGGFGARGRHLGAYALVYLNVLSILGVLVGLLAFVFTKGAPVVVQGITVGPGAGPETTIRLFGFAHTVVWPVDWPFVMNGVSLYAEVSGVLPAIVGTVWLVVGAVLFAVPLGVGAAVFLAEYAEEGRFTQVVEVATNALWSTPSIVFGLFGYAFLVPRFGGSKSLLSGMLTLGFMLLPLVVITSREAMLAVPDDYRDASAALGVSKWQTIRSVVVPASLPGVITGVILGVGRIAGETAPILLTMAGATEPSAAETADVVGGFALSSSPPFVTNPALLEATSALPYQLYAIISAGVGGDAAFGWGTALVLLVVVLTFYAVGIASRTYFRRKLHE
ncbi:phosphate ABC transporter permease PstA [Halobacteria archaeon HArc-gm2]|nr:phosphate ABC transporter permease PstA [Halobacteria archaeon HArc-gm2]